MSNFKFICFVIALNVALWIAAWLPWWWSTGIGFFEYWGRLKELFHRPSAEERAKARTRWFGTDEERRRQLEQDWPTPPRDAPAEAAPTGDEFPETEIEIGETQAIKK